MQMIMIRIRMRRPHDLLFPQNRRVSACAKVKYFFECYPEMCDQLTCKGSSLFFDLVGATAPVRKRSAYSMVYLAPIIVCFRRVVKSFL